MNDKALRQQLASLLNSGDAHANFDTVVKDMPPALRGKKPDGAQHSPWQVLEHLRIALWDILEFARNAQHQSPEFPQGYWPSTQSPPDEKAWDKSASSFRADLEALIKLVSDEKTDLFASIPHGSGQTILRQALVAADHNAYHLGELVLLRRELGAWQ